MPRALCNECARIRASAKRRARGAATGAVADARQEVVWSTSITRETETPGTGETLSAPSPRVPRPAVEVSGSGAASSREHCRHPVALRHASGTIGQTWGHCSTGREARRDALADGALEHCPGVRVVRQRLGQLQNLQRGRDERHLSAQSRCAFCDTRMVLSGER